MLYVMIAAAVVLTTAAHWLSEATEDSPGWVMRARPSTWRGRLGWLAKLIGVTIVPVTIMRLVGGHWG
jgi:hypothetical protein